LQQLLRFAHEQSVIRSKEYGVRFYETGYRFLTLNEEKGTWDDLQDRLLRSRTLPEPLEIELYIEETLVELLISRAEEPDPPSEDEDEDKLSLTSAASGIQLAGEVDEEVIKPQVFILSSSELTPPFQVRMRVPGSEVEELLEGLVQGQYNRIKAQ